jgi:hypothetical protein
MPETIARLVDLIGHDPAPVVLLDTCALLDVIRIPHRDELQLESIEAALSIARRAQAVPRGTWLIAATLVETEWVDNCNPVAEESRREIAKLERRLDRLRGVAKHVLPLEMIGPLELGRLQIEELLKAAAQALIRMAHIVEPDPDSVMRARTRVVAGVAPAARGRQEYKDCEIFEHYLSLGRALRALGFQPDLFFVSSNTKDYGSPNELPAQVAADLQSARIEFVTSLGWLDARLA